MKNYPHYTSITELDKPPKRQRASYNKLVDKAERETGSKTPGRRGEVVYTSRPLRIRFNGTKVKV